MWMFCWSYGCERQKQSYEHDICDVILAIKQHLKALESDAGQTQTLSMSGMHKVDYWKKIQHTDLPLTIDWAREGYLLLGLLSKVLALLTLPLRVA